MPRDITLNSFKNDTIRFLLFGIFILATRLPFLAHGFGIDSDAWGIALTAKLIAESGQYEVSRFPGYPFVELTQSLLYKGGPFLCNLMTALMSVMGVIFFALTLRKLRFKYIFLASTALAFAPVLYINSTNSMDYIWAFAFSMACMYFVVIKKPVAAGIMLGLAIGCRITSGAMLLPYAIMFLGSDYSAQNIKKGALLVITALATGAICFLPVFLRYKFDFFAYYDVPYPAIAKVLYKFAFEVWGVLGFFGLFCAVLLLFTPSRHKVHQYLLPRSVNINYVLPWLIEIDLYIIAFIILPMESGYLIPVIPFVILIFAKYLYDRAFIFFAWTLILSPFLGGISAVNRKDAPDLSHIQTAYLNIGGERLAFNPFQGSVLINISKRESAQDYVEKVMHAADTLTTNTVIVSARWYNQVVFQWTNHSAYSVSFVPFMTHDELHIALDMGSKVYYLPDADIANDLRNGFDLKDEGITPFI